MDCARVVQRGLSQVWTKSIIKFKGTVIPKKNI